MADPVIHNTADGNVTVFFGDKLVLKFFRRVGTDINPELEISRLLTEKNFPHSPPLLGALEYRGDDRSQMTLAVAKAFVPHAKNGWEFTLDAIGRYYERVVADVAQGHLPPATPAEVTEQVGTYLESARLLGVRTAELHLALASGAPGQRIFGGAHDAAIPARPVPVHAFPGLEKPAPAAETDENAAAGPDSGRPARQSNWNRSSSSIIAISSDNASRPDASASTATVISARCCGRAGILCFSILRVIRRYRSASAASNARRCGTSPGCCVHSIMRRMPGFHQQAERGVISRENLPKFEPWVRHWNRAVSRAYLQAYCQQLHPSGILPGEEDQTAHDTRGLPAQPGRG